MPDANGNLTGIGDFIDGRRVRFQSYLDSANLVLSVRDRGCCVHNLTNPSPSETIFTIAGAENGYFTLRTAREVYLFWGYGPPGRPARLTWYLAGMASEWSRFRFTVDMLDGCWFALNRVDREVVADVEYSRTAEGTPVIAYEWNGGHNQYWRAQLIP